MESQVDLITELREKFFKKLNDEGAPDSRGFHTADIERIKHNNDWLRRFLEHNEYDLQESLSMLWEACNWRRKFGTNDISEDNVRKDYLEDGVIFSYGKDKDGKTLFIIKSKLHKGAKDFGELQRCIIYWFERLEREGNGNQISLFFDMADAGLSNMDTEFTKYLIGLFKSYYPNFLNYIIVFEKPWILNAAFIMIKSWLPAKAISKIKFVTKSTLKDIVDPNYILKCWGGTNDYTFTFVSEEKTSTENAITHKLDNNKVHFAESSPLTEQPPSGFGYQVSEEQLLSIEPEVIIFNKEGNKIIGRIMLQNVTADKSLSYKIKTTSPQKFKVKPSTGIITPSERCSITVALQSGYNLHGLINNDKFLVMCLPIKSSTLTAQELTTIWKSSTPAEERRLKCCSILSTNTKEENQQTIDALHYQVNRLEQSCNKLYKELKYLQVFSIILTVLMAIAIIYILKSDIQNVDLQNCHIHHDL